MNKILKYFFKLLASIAGVSIGANLYYIQTLNENKEQLTNLSKQLTNANQLIEECITEIDNMDKPGTFMDTVGSGDTYYNYRNFNN